MKNLDWEIFPCPRGRERPWPKLISPEQRPTGCLSERFEVGSMGRAPSPLSRLRQWDRSNAGNQILHLLLGNCLWKRGSTSEPRVHAEVPSLPPSVNNKLILVIHFQCREEWEMGLAQSFIDMVVKSPKEIKQWLAVPDCLVQWTLGQKFHCVSWTVLARQEHRQCLYEGFHSFLGNAWRTEGIIQRWIVEGEPERWSKPGWIGHGANVFPLYAFLLGASIVGWQLPFQLGDIFIHIVPYFIIRTM